ncbi:hypothetical protein Tco_0344132 [Tanacetum coccineum]
MEDLKKHYLDEMLSLSNQIQIKDYRNEKIDIRFRRECESMIDELKVSIQLPPPEELNSEIPDAIIESFSPSHIPVKDSNSLMEEIDIFLAPDDSISPGIKNDNYDSEGDVLFLAELLNNNKFPFLRVFDNEKWWMIFSNKLLRELYVHVPNVLPTFPTLHPVFDILLLFSSKNEDKVFNPGILISNEEKSPHLLSHWGFKVFQLINDFESPMMIYGGDIPILDVPYLHFYPP